MERPFLQG